MKKMLYICTEVNSKLTYPLMSAIRTRGSLDQADILCGLTTHNCSTCTVEKKHNGKLPSSEGFRDSKFYLTCREGKLTVFINEEGEDDEYIILPYTPDLIKFIC